MAITIVSGDILNADTKYIAHQCNCVTDRAEGLAKKIFSVYDNIYDKRTIATTAGTISMSHYYDKTSNRPSKPIVINIFAQIYPGKTKYKSGSDSATKRAEYFESCLMEILKIADLTSIAFPYNIGCGLAGGDSKIYNDMLNVFANKTAAKVYIYKLT
ncbi:MAG: hypothetical protein Faunusvirus7_21 [Faunusvirus sp.]|jgi:O-acetyl-ADP-ribose deacetylase (regulator of RNase III)|uniref:Macro domain-containing protein n=1 Tax=Faunusvirus sp. TaxID=2487766 RepID=A0A3G5A0B4_9VIRU|nr:MAG: hypothetical protein Faunusvirus7_21 [Faunusvirus sp.]